VTPEKLPNQWDNFISKYPDSHLLQSRAWGELKSSFGWSARQIIKENCGAQILFRSLPLGFTIAYIPKGPIGSWIPDLLPDLDRICREQNAIFLKIEPDSTYDPTMEERLRQHGFSLSPQTIQPLQTLIVDLSGGEEQILGRMRQKTRYNIRLASRKEVEIETWDDLGAFSKLMLETGARDEFGVHSQAYYQTAYDLFYQADACEIFVAKFEGRPIATIFVFAAGHRAWYFYGASSNAERNRMPTYLLQWEAMRWAIQRGCSEYDLWGIPPEEETVLEQEFTSRNDGLWGVYRFKRGFGGTITKAIGAWDRPYSKPLYSVYRWIGAQIWNT
jgi:lipid II:glycine glycyltransferase (peptidoglycan interpeptide bridge formation enzyme)